MNTEIQIFEGQKRRMSVENGEPWFVVKDVAEMQGYSRTADVIRQHVDDEDKGSLKCRPLAEFSQSFSSTSLVFTP